MIPLEFSTPPYSPPMDRQALSKAVLDSAHELGFSMAGISPARPSPYADYVRQWIGGGFHGQMDYLQRNLEVRLDPGQMLDHAQAVICVADRYPSQSQARPEAQRQTADESEGTSPMGRVARYAWGDDYHKVMKKRLHALADRLAANYPDAGFRSVVDTAPVMEREHAARAGLGWIGKHTLMLHPYHGSWFLLGNIITTLDLATSEQLDDPGYTVRPADHCGTCTRCIDACPTDAIAPEGYQLDATRCISYLTLEHRSEIDPRFHEAMDDWIAGCDICQEVCPYNLNQEAGHATGKRVPPPTHRRYQPRNTAFSLTEVLDWDEQDRRDAFAGSALKRMKLAMVKRNALIAAANQLAKQPNPALGRRIEQLAEDENEPALVRETARQVLGS